MRDEETTDRIAEALEKLAAKIDGAIGSGKRRSPEQDEPPRSVSSLNRGRGEDPLEIQGVLFQVRVPIGGGRGETMPAYLLLPGVRDEGELEQLADDVERRFKFATVYQPRNGYRRDRYGYENRGYYRDRR